MWLCVCSTLVMWSELRAGSENCWVALRGSFHPGNRQTASMQAERRDGRPDGWMDGCQAEKRCGRVRETDADKRPVAFSYHGKNSPLSFSSSSLCGFFNSSHVKMLACIYFSVARQVWTFVFFNFDAFGGGNVDVLGWLCCVLWSLETAADSPCKGIKLLVCSHPGSQRLKTKWVWRHYSDTCSCSSYPEWCSLQQKYFQFLKYQHDK